jgi:hypothetical protein
MSIFSKKKINYIWAQTPSVVFHIYLLALLLSSSLVVIDGSFNMICRIWGSYSGNYEDIFWGVTLDSSLK